MLAVLLVGCRTESAFQEQARARLGLDLNDVLSEIGPPTSEYLMPNGHRLLTWHRDGPTVAATNFYGSGAFTVAKTRSCDLTYEVDERGRIVGERHEGRCRS